MAVLLTFLDFLQVVVEVTLAVIALLRRHQKAYRKNDPL